MTHGAPTSSVTLTLGEFQAIALTRALRGLRAIVRAPEVAEGEVKFEKREPSPLLSSAGPRELADEIASVAPAAREGHPSRAAEIGRIAELARELSQARTALDALRIYHDLVDLPDASGKREHVRFSADRLRVHVTVRGDGDYLHAISELFGHARAQGRKMTTSEHAALDVADWQLRSGVPLRTAFACIGTSGFRGVQTWLSLADPGPDHVRITAWDSELLRGLIVHVEHIDRDMVADKEKVEPYRLPAAWHAARARLRVGVTVPCTAFIGRPVFENHASAQAVTREGFEMDILKTAHLQASACTAMFVNGIADCKIAIERMTGPHAVRFMRAVAGNVLRDRDRQTLSAAFNLNTPLHVEGEDGVVTLRDRYDIGHAGVQLARAGGFDKIAWDGASNEVPSKPITEQLTATQLVDLVHFAHSNGLETYISAGMVAEHMRDAVLAGVDGVGIGTSMHYVDASTKLMGALKPDAIQQALRVRDEAEATPLGRAAAMLARIDQMHFEGSLLASEQSPREALHAALRSRDERATLEPMRALGRAAAIEPMPLDSNPTLARGRRRLELLRINHGDVSMLGEALARRDAVTVRELIVRA